MEIYPYQKKLMDKPESRFMFQGTRSYRDVMSSEILRNGKKGDRIAIVSPDRRVFLKITEIEETNETNKIQGSQSNTTKT